MKRKKKQQGSIKNMGEKKQTNRKEKNENQNTKTLKTNSPIKCKLYFPAGSWMRQRKKRKIKKH